MFNNFFSVVFSFSAWLAEFAVNDLFCFQENHFYGLLSGLLLFDQWSRFCLVVSLHLRRKIKLSPCLYGSHIPFPGLYISPLCLWTLAAAQVFSPSSSTHLLICSTLKQRDIFQQGFPELHCLTSFIFQNAKLLHLCLKYNFPGCKILDSYLISFRMP